MPHATQIHLTSVHFDSFATNSKDFDLAKFGNLVLRLTFLIFTLNKIAFTQQAVWRKRGCCLVGHFAGFWNFCSRPSLTDTPACRQAAKTLSASRRAVYKIERLSIKM